MDNMTRLKNLMKRAANGESLVIGFLGGSITQGSLSSTPKTCYAYLVYEWWKKSFPNAAFSFVNGGIGGTSSHMEKAEEYQQEKIYIKDRKEHPLLFWWSGAMERGKWCEKT